MIFWMKGAGCLLVVASGVMVGTWAAHREKSRIGQLQLQVFLIDAFERELSFQGRPVGQMLRLLLQEERFAALDYLSRALALLEEGESFCTAWTQAVKSSRLCLSREDRRILAQLGQVLGASGRQQQLATLGHLCALVQERAQAGRAQLPQQMRLRQTLGTLAGAACALLML